MADLVRVEPSIFRADEAWFIYSDGKQYLRKRDREVNACRSSLGFPTIMGRFAEPIQSQADGKFYTDNGSLERSYRASGNPQGVDYVCIGDDTAACTTFTPPPRDDKAAHEAIRRTLDEHGI